MSVAVAAHGSRVFKPVRPPVDAGYMGQTVTAREQLGPSDQERLTELEAVIERGLAVFVEVGLALMEIKNSRLYRETHATFEEYVDQRWGMSRTRGYQMIDAAVVSTMVDAAGLPAPVNERQARELAPLLRDEGEEAIIAVWRDLREQHGDRITAEKVKAAVREKLRYESSVRALVSSASQEWYTPSEYIEAAREVLGGIDLDPASSEQANETVRAARYYTAQDDGLVQEWRGRVWMNPPYGAICGSFVAKLVDAYEAGDAQAAVMCLNGRSFDTHWFQPLWDYPICFTDHRPSFRNPDRDEHDRPTVGSIFVYLGPSDREFERVFSSFGHVARDPLDRAWWRAVDRAADRIFGTEQEMQELDLRNPLLRRRA